MGEPFQEHEARSADNGEDQVPYQRQGDGRLGHVDRLAVPHGRVVSAGQVPVHAAVHLPLRVLHAAGEQEGAGEAVKQRKH